MFGAATGKALVVLVGVVALVVVVVVVVVVFLFRRVFFSRPVVVFGVAVEKFASVKEGGVYV